jgi:histidine triad (HIT) family protein
MKVVKQISLQIKSVYRPMRVGMMVFGTEVPHAHVHLIPLYTGNEMTIVRSEGETDHKALAQVASDLKISA